MPTISCLHCGKTTEAQRSTRKFCSADCRLAHHRIEKQISSFNPNSEAKQFLSSFLRSHRNLTNHPVGKGKLLECLDELQSGLDEMYKTISENDTPIQRKVI